jgi:hypothetical protein
MPLRDGSAPAYVTPAAGVRALDVVTGLLLLLVVVIVTGLLLAGAPAGVAFVFSLWAVPAVLVWLIVPRRFEVWGDHLAIVFLVGRWKLAYDSIEAVVAAKWWHPYAFLGVRLALSPGRAVDVMRRGANLVTRPHVVISPRDRQEFLEGCDRALSRYRAEG